MYKELEESIDEVLQEVNETDEFKRAIKNIIRRSFSHSNLNNDLKDLLELTNVFTGEGFDEGQNSRDGV